MTNLEQIQRHFKKGKGYSRLVVFLFKIGAIKIHPEDGLKLSDEAVYPTGYFKISFRLYHPLLILMIAIFFSLGWLYAIVVAGVPGIIEYYTDLTPYFFRKSEKKSVW